MKTTKLTLAAAILAGGLALGAQAPASAQSNPYVGDIMMFAGTFCPRGWAPAAGQLMAISQNDALFSLYGTNYGGDGRTTFGLPDLRGRVPVHNGDGPGLDPIRLGETGGYESNVMTLSSMPAHSHAVHASNSAPASRIPANNELGDFPANATNIYSTGAATVQMNGATVSTTGSSVPFNNVQETVAIQHCVALYGMYPPRN